MFDKFSFFPDTPQVRYLVTGSESGSESESESESKYTDLLYCDGLAGQPSDIRWLRGPRTSRATQIPNFRIGTVFFCFPNFCEFMETSIEKVKIVLVRLFLKLKFSEY